MYDDLKSYSSFCEVWSESAKENSDRTAFIWGGEEYSYFEIEMMVNSFSRALVEQYEVKKGDHIAILLNNSVPFIVSYLAAQRVRAVPVPFNTRLKSQQFDLLFDTIKPVLIITSSAFQNAVEHLLESHLCVKYRIGVDIEDPDWESFDNLCSAFPDEVEFELPKRDDIATILFTSGTTGKPKGAIIRHGDLLWNIFITAEVFKFRSDDVHILTVPLFHCTGLESIFPTSVYFGSTCVIDDQINPAYLSELLTVHSATTFITVPTVLYLLVSSSSCVPEQYKSLRLIGFSGSPIGAETLSRVIELFPNCELVNFYGLTETTSIITCCYRDDLQKFPSSIGKAFKGIEMRIADNDRLCAPGELGELQVARKHVVSGYFKMPGEIDKRISGGWFKTGDLAMTNERGLVFLKGRNNDLIIVGGENVFAPEVEGVLNSHPDIRESAVVGIPNKVFGEVVKAYVVPKQSGIVSTLELKRFCFERLPSYKVPLEIAFIDALPRSPSGKILKGMLPGEQRQ